MHQFITNLALVFAIVHGLATWIDPFTAFAPAEVLVPLASHYRPIWVAFGIVTGYLLAALWISERIRPLIGYAWWRRFHVVAFVAYLLATVHGLSTGSDTRTPWAIGLYTASLAAVSILVAWRLLPSGPNVRRRPVLAAIGVILVADLALWAALGPLRPGWNEVANNGQGSGQAGQTLPPTGP